MMTIKELAKKLNISPSTVSKALNDSPEISLPTIKRVKEAAKIYNYKPNKVALSLKSNSTKTIGVILPDILNHFFAKVLLGIEKEATENGYNIITCLSNEFTSKEKDSLELLSNGSVDGFILSVAEETQVSKESAHFKSIKDQNIPLVMFDRVANDIECDKIIIDDFKAAYDATKFLIDKGRKQIALISNIDNLSVGKLRLDGYKKAIEDHQEVSTETLILSVDRSEDPQKKIADFLDKHKNIDGIFAADNTSGVVAINLSRSKGKSVPEDISVIGFADASIANYSTPKLSTINQHADEIGRMSLNLLIKRLHNKDEIKKYETTVIPVTIDQREST
ncbi:substrate-binding domain-containing protein [Winogradskyella sp. 3972H.M.0a.05]|uniref:LacI family DNA-binding transcriptional regulator n=1 Tax=Winogradskyella sp. 3972H.M.0a.05 TaxID=2950277 RepID=UPI0033968CF1